MKVDFTLFKNIELMGVEWLWPGFIPRGKLTVLAGLQGIGKGFIVCDFLGRLSSGQAWPGEVEHPTPWKGYALYVTGEDDPRDTIKPRLMAAGADESRIGLLNGIIDEDGKLYYLSLKHHIEAIRKQALEGLSVLIIDPIVAFMSGVDTWKDASVRETLSLYAQVCTETGLTIVWVMHLRKSETHDLVHKIGGSIAFTAAARQVLLAVETVAGRYIGPLKTNIGPLSHSWEYTIPQTEKGVPRITWMARAPHISLVAQEHYSDSEYEKSKLAEAKDWLALRFEERAVWEAKELRQQASENGISPRTLQRARAALGIQTRPVYAAGKILAYEWFTQEF